METGTILAMAVAVVAEQENIEIKHVKVLSFKEIQKSSLEKYIEEHNIEYRKYYLGDN